MSRGYVLFEVKAVEEPFLVACLLAHHPDVPPSFLLPMGHRPWRSVQKSFSTESAESGRWGDGLMDTAEDDESSDRVLNRLRWRSLQIGLKPCLAFRPLLRGMHLHPWRVCPLRRCCSPAPSSRVGTPVR